jgi:hypothetical protein
VRKADILVSLNTVFLFASQPKTKQEYMSEGSSQLLTQPFFPSDTSTHPDGHTIIGCGLTQAKKDATNKPRFVDFACSHSEVGVKPSEIFRTLTAYNRSIDTLYWSQKRSSPRRSGEARRTSRLSSVVGDVVLGCRWLSNLAWDADVREFIQLRRFENLSLHHVLQDIKVSKCEWLGPPRADGKSKKHINVTDSLKRREIFEEFVFWYFNSFLLPLLSVSFLSSPASGAKRTVVSLHSM